jgi:hypothetical protein
MVMKPAEDRLRYDGNDPLNWARDRRIFVQRPVYPEAVVVMGISSQDLTQMRFVQYDHMVETSLHGSATVIWRATHSAVGFVDTVIQTGCLRSRRTMTKA